MKQVKENNTNCKTLRFPQSLITALFGDNWHTSWSGGWSWSK